MSEEQHCIPSLFTIRMQPAPRTTLQLFAFTYHAPFLPQAIFKAVWALLQKVLGVRRDTETGVRTFVRSKAWRDASKVEPVRMLLPMPAPQLPLDTLLYIASQVDVASSIAVQ